MIIIAQLCLVVQNHSTKFNKPDECMEHSKGQFHTALSRMNLEKHGVLVGEVLRTHESGTKSNLEEETDAVLYHHS